jgi:hypothetical protein
MIDVVFYLFTIFVILTMICLRLREIEQALEKLVKAADRQQAQAPAARGEPPREDNPPAPRS